MDHVNTCCSLNNDRCVLECNNLNNCCILNVDAALDIDISFPLDPSDLFLVDISDVSSTLDPLVCDIEIPQFPVKINVNELDEIPTLDELLEASITDPVPSVTDQNSNKNLSYDEMQKVMHDIEDTVNFTSMDESMDALNNPDIIFSRLQSAFDTFKEKTGRQMTYSEMRYMMG